MKYQTLKAVLFTLVLICAGASIKAQTAGDKMSVKIPFSFSVGKTTLPAGKYVVKRISQTSSAFALQSRETRKAAMTLAGGSLSGRRSDPGPKLVFHNYGGNYFLSQIWMPSYEVGNALTASKRERELRQELAKAGKVGPQLVTLLTTK